MIKWIYYVNATQQAYQGLAGTNDNTRECEPSVHVHYLSQHEQQQLIN